MTAIEIKRVTPEDLHQLQGISHQTFMETYAKVNSQEAIKMYLEESFSYEKLAEELENKYSQFYFAFLNKEVIGYLKLNFGPAQTELKDGNGLEIERIYVLQDFRGKNVGRLIFDKAIEIAKSMYKDYIWLGVWEENQRAIHFYRKIGLL